MSVGAALAAAAEIGPFFRVRMISPEALSGESTLARVYAGGPAVGERVRATAEALGVTDRRVAGSIFFQGLAARIWSPTLAVAVRERRVLLLPPDETMLEDSVLACSRPVLSAQVSGELPDDGSARDGSSGGPRDGPSSRLAVEMHRAVIDAHLEPLAAVLDVPPTTLWGNVASAAVGSYQVMTAARPELADIKLLGSLLRFGRLADTGRLDDVGRFHRESCCLFYRTPGGGLCGDCVLHHREGPRSLPGR